MLRNRIVLSMARRLAQRASAALRAAASTPLLPAAAALLCIVAYAGQLGLGRWQGDEFLLFADQRTWDWRTIETRLLFAPRPFSEIILFLYGEVVLAAGRALIAPFLALLWVGVLGSALWAAWGVLPPSRGRLAAALALTAALFAFVLMTNSITELFYWPMAAAAYLPLGGAAIALLFLLSHPLNRNRRLGCGAALMLAATSSEMGAALAIGFAGAAAIEAASRLAILPRPKLSTAFREAAWWLPPGLAGLAVLAVVALVRVSGAKAGLLELGADPQPYYTGHAATSMIAGLRRLALDLPGGNEAGESHAAMLGALATKLLFAFGFAAVWRQADRAGATPGRWHMVLAVSLISATFFSVAAAYYHYGTLCCERQEATRFWLIDVLAILGAAWLLARLPPLNAKVGKACRAAWLPPLLLTLSLFPILSRIEGLRQDYRNYQLAIDGHKRTWRSGQRAGGDRMQFYYPPDGSGMLIRGTFQSIGTFRTGIDAPGIVSAAGRFFGKAIVDTCQPWQTDKSWLLNGQFIPACPPHAGPPDIVYTSP